MKTFARLGRLRAVLATHSTNPYLRGRAAQLAGGALVADGLIGLENPLDGRKTRGGILGGVIFAVVGLIFVWVIGATLAASEPYPDGHIVHGTVISVEESTSRSSKGRTSTTCQVIVEFTDAAGTTQARSGYGSSSQCDMVGRAVDVSVRANDPGSARVIITDDRAFLTVARYVMWGVVALGAWVFLIRLVSIVAGVVLFVRGRRLVAAHPAVPVEALLADLRTAWTGEPGAPGPDPATSSGGPEAGGALARVLAGVGFSTVQQPAAPAGPAAPPAGWMLDPAGSGRQRWWDGTRWTEHYR